MCTHCWNTQVYKANTVWSKGWGWLQAVTDRNLNSSLWSVDRPSKQNQRKTVREIKIHCRSHRGPFTLRDYFMQWLKMPTYKKLFKQLERWPRALTGPTDGWVWLPAPMWWLTSISNCSSWELDALFGPLPGTGTHTGIHIHIDK